MCANCGEVFDEGKLVCPGCGADTDLTLADAPVGSGYADPGLDDDEYTELLEQEGLAPKRRRAGCLVLILPALAVLL